MYRDEIKEKIEQLSMDVVLVDPSDGDELGDILLQFNGIKDLAAENNDADLLSRASAAAGIIETLIERGNPNPSAVIDEIGETVSLMQHHARENRLEENSAPSLPPAEVEPSGDNDPGAGGLRHPGKLPDYLDDNLFSEFLTLQTEILEKIENLILDIEETASDSNIKELKRIFHTLKGEAGFLNLLDVEQLCHKTEDIMEKTDAVLLTDLLLSVKDWIASAFKYYSGNNVTPEDVGRLISEIDNFRSDVAAAASHSVSETPPTLDTMKSDGPHGMEDSPAWTHPSVTDGITDAPERETIPLDDPGSDDFHEDFFLDTGVLDSTDEFLVSHFKNFARNNIEVAAQSLVLALPDSMDTELLVTVRESFSRIKGVADFIALRGLAMLCSLGLRVAEAYTRERSREVLPLLSEAAACMETLVDRITAAVSLDGHVEYDPAWGETYNKLSAFEGNMAGPCCGDLPFVLPGEQTDSEATGSSLEPGSPTALPDMKIVKTGDSPPALSFADKDKRERPRSPHAKEKSTAPTSPVMEKPASPTPFVKESPVAPASTAAPAKSRSAPAQQVQNMAESVKVKADRLDRMIDMIGELVIAESMVTQSSEIRLLNSPELIRQMGQLNKITRELQEAGLSLRMIPIRATFRKMSRVIRDTARKSGKKIRFTLSGEETELDKTVVDSIGDPLLHMVRNAVDHGIESTPDDRIKKGKPEVGSVELRAFHRGGNIYIQIEDDGRGLHKDAILHKAFERGLIDGEKELSEQEIHRMIFEPGFSTAENVTDISGRGVGMDVVRTAVETINGSIEIDSAPGKGSVFTIRLPVTLAIIDGMVVVAGDQRYIIPTLSIITSMPFDQDDTTGIFEAGNMVRLQDALVPLVSTELLFPKEDGEEPVVPDRGLMVVLEENGKQAALVVDEIIGKQQIVIKPLQESMGKIPGISGGAIMSDGRVSLILDVETFVNFAHQA